MIEKGRVENIKGVGKVYIEDKIVLNNPIPLNMPGVNTPKINPEIEIEGGGSGGGPTTLTFIVPALSSGIIEFNGFGFSPKRVNIKATGNSVISPETVSDIIKTGDIISGWSIKDDASNRITTRGYSLSFSGNISRGDNPIFIGDGVSMEILNSDFEVLLTITCFK